MLATESGKPARQDYEYARFGKANLFVAVEPLSGWRHVRVTDRHTSVDFAQELRFAGGGGLPGGRSGGFGDG